MSDHTLSINCLCGECGVRTLEVVSVPVAQFNSKLVYGRYCPTCLSAATDGTGSFGDFTYWCDQVKAWVVV